MNFHPILMTISLLIVVSGLLVIKIERWYLTEPMVAMLLGALLSPYGFELVDTQAWGDTKRFLKLAAMLTISMSLMSAAYQLPRNYPIDYKKTQAVILLLIMPLMFALSGILAYWTLDLPLALAFLVGAVITPTDPVVSATIVSGKFAEKYLPDSIRHTITFESAANDGLAYPLVMMMLFILGYYDAGSTWEWLLRAVGWETIGAAAMGLVARLWSGASRTCRTPARMDERQDAAVVYRGFRFLGAELCRSDAGQRNPRGVCGAGLWCCAVYRSGKNSMRAGCKQ